MVNKQQEPKKDNPKSELTYEGKVTIESLRNNKRLVRKRVKNKGTKHLFKYILDCLYGNYDANRRPYYIMPYKEETGTKKYAQTTFIPPSFFKVDAKSDPDHPVLELKFVINYLVAKEGVNGFVLYSPEVVTTIRSTGSITTAQDLNPEYMVEVKVTIDLEESADYDKLITWQMYIDNKPEETE